MKIMKMVENNGDDEHVQTHCIVYWHSNSSILLYCIFDVVLFFLYVSIVVVLVVDIDRLQDHSETRQSTQELQTKCHRYEHDVEPR